MPPIQLHSDAGVTPAPAAQAAVDEETTADYHGMMDIIFAIVIGMNLETLFTASPAGRPFWGVVAAYFVVILSWAGYHKSLHKHPYRKGWLSGVRFAVDFAIVVLYAYFLWITDGLGDPANLASYLGVFTLLFLLYLVGGALRQMEHTRGASQQGKLAVALAAESTLLAIYLALHPMLDAAWLERIAWGALMAPVLVYLAWRFWRRVGG